MTKGEYRVGVDFNPTGNEVVSQIKAHAAGLIDLIEDIPVYTVPEIGRLKALAQTAIEEGAMWAVKAATKRPWDAENATRVPHPVTDDLALARSMDDPNFQELVEEPKEE